MRDKVTKITRSMKRITALLTLFLAMTFISCKSGKTVGENPFFAEWETPYGVPPFDKIEPEHFLPAIERGMSLHEAEIDAITSNNDAPTFENVILAYDASGKMLSQVELIFGMLCAAENTSEMQALEEQIMPRMAAHADKIRLNGKLFERIKAVYDRRAALDSTRAEPSAGEDLPQFRARRSAARRRAEGASEGDQRGAVAHGREVRAEPPRREQQLCAGTRLVRSGRHSGPRPAIWPAKRPRRWAGRANTSLRCTSPA